MGAPDPFKDAIILKTPVLYVSVDVQERYLQKLTDNRAAYMRDETQRFSNQLKQVGVNTAWVYYDQAEDKAGRENVFVKETASAFLSGVWKDKANKSFNNFDEKLRGEGVQTILISGMNSSACVPSTCIDALDRGYSVIIVSDLLANTRLSPQREAKQAEHIEILRDKILDGLGCENFAFATREQVVKALKAYKTGPSP